MRALVLLGVALAVSGTIVLAVPTGGQTSSQAVRDANIGVVGDSQALLRITTPQVQGGAVPLRPSDADFGGCYGQFCFDYYYFRVSLLRLSDNAPVALSIEQLSYRTSNQSMTVALSNQSTAGGQRVSGTFRCGNDNGRQLASTATVTVSATARNGTVEVSATRTVDVSCIAG